MTTEMWLSLFGWGAVINIGFLLWWFLWIIFAHNLIYRMHTRWFNMSVETFNAIHYAGIAFYKIIVIVFFVIPYLVLRFLI